VPPATSVTGDPDTDTVQTDVVSELKLTVKGEVADALTGNGAAPYTRPGNVKNVIV
jgi:hypothetical protein